MNVLTCCHQNFYYASRCQFEVTRCKKESKYNYSHVNSRYVCTKETYMQGVSPLKMTS